MRIQSDTLAQKAVLGSGRAHQGLANSLERISTGRQINKAADDASGMSIASSLNSRALAMGQGIKNATDGISIAQIADNALGGMTDILQSIRTNVLAAASGSQSQESRNAIQAEIAGSIQALDDIAQSTTYNGQNLLDGTFSNKSFMVGEQTVIGMTIPGVGSQVLGSGEGNTLATLDVTTEEGASSALSTVDQALDQVVQARSSLGSTQNQFSSSINNLAVSRISMASSRSQIMDVDLAEESMVLNQMKVLEKASLFALSQAGQVKKNSIASLLG